MESSERAWRVVLGLTPLFVAGVLPVVLVGVLDLPPVSSTGTAFSDVASRPAVGMGVAVAFAAVILLANLGPRRTLAGFTAFTWVVGVVTGGWAVAQVVWTLEGTEPWWTARLVAGSVIACVAMLVWWIAERGTGPAAEATSRPDPSAPRLELAPHERAAWSRSVFSRRALLAAAGGVVAGGVLLALSSSVVGVVWLLWLLAGEVAVLVTAWARVRIDEDRVSVVQPLLGRTITEVELRHVVEAGSQPIGDELDDRRYGVFHDDHTFGYRALRTGDLLTLRLADGRRFLVTAPDAATAAALVNTLLDRREGGVGAHPDRSDVDDPAG